jgi:hypothetical protein
MKALLFKLALAKLKGEQTMIKRYLSFIGIGTLALLVAVPANAKTVDKNKAFNDCRKEVRNEFNGARPRLKKIRGYGGEWNIEFRVFDEGVKQKVLCTLDKHSGEKMLTLL